MSDQGPIRISELNEYLKLSLENDPLLQNMTLIGEITNLRRYTYGRQLYLTLSDGDAKINGVIYENFLANLNFEPKNGQNVLVKGKVKFFHKKGNITVQIAYMQPAGEGEAKTSFEKLKAKLAKEGLFDAVRKKTIPAYPSKIGLITAVPSAAYQDIRRIVSQLPHLHIVVQPAVVQGLQAPATLTAALDTLDQAKVDVICICRGGGSAEDLAAFNDERLIRQIAATNTPILTGIGHDIDISLSDLAADRYAATPTAAANILISPFLGAKQRVFQQLSFTCSTLRSTLEQQQKDLNNRLSLGMKQISHCHRQKQKEISQILQQVTWANPLHKLGQGFSICRLETTGKTIRSVNQLQPGDSVTTQLKDGHFLSQIQHVSTKGGNRNKAKHEH